MKKVVHIVLISRLMNLFNISANVVADEFIVSMFHSCCHFKTNSIKYKQLV